MSAIPTTANGHAPATVIVSRYRVEVPPGFDPDGLRRLLGCLEDDASSSTPASTPVKSSPSFAQVHAQAERVMAEFTAFRELVEASQRPPDSFVCLFRRLQRRLAQAAEDAQTMHQELQEWGWVPRQAA